MKTVIDLAQLPVIGICGFSGAGKTSLVVDLVRLLARRGLRTLVIKHDAHGVACSGPATNDPSTPAGSMAKPEYPASRQDHRHLCTRAPYRGNSTDEMLYMTHLRARRLEYGT